MEHFLLCSWGGGGLITQGKTWKVLFPPTRSQKLELKILCRVLFFLTTSPPTLFFGFFFTSLGPTAPVRLLVVVDIRLEEVFGDEVVLHAVALLVPLGPRRV